MKVIFLWLGVMACFLFADSKLDQQLIEKIHLLDENNEHMLARELLGEMATDKETKLAVMQELIQMDKEFADKLEKYKKTSLTTMGFDQKVCSAKLEQTKNSLFDFTLHQIPIADLGKDLYDGYHYIKGDRTDIYAKNEKLEKDLNNLSSKTYDIFDMNEAKKLIKQYDILKKSLNKLRILKIDYFKECDINVLKKAAPLLNQIGDLKNVSKRIEQILSLMQSSVLILQKQKSLFVFQMPKIL